MRFRRLVVAFALFGISAGIFTIAHADPGAALFTGAAKEDLTPFTRPGDPLSNADGLACDATCAREDTFRSFSHFEGTITSNGVWGEHYEDVNHNGRYDARARDGAGEPFSDDPNNTMLDKDSAGKWDGIYLAGFGADRAATGVLDKIWARAAVFVEAEPGQDLDDPERPSRSVAIVSLDVLGYYSDWTGRIMDQARSLWLSLPQHSTFEFYLDRLILSHTGNHQGPDVHVGLWGPNSRTDGSYPLYERYIERKIAVAVVRAMLQADEQTRQGNHTTIRAGAIRGTDQFRTHAGNAESLEGTQARSACRAPWFFDDELRAMQAIDAKSGGTIVSFINWGTRNESLEGGNTRISSDFAGAARDELESRIGGVALWFPGAQGSVEIVGDSCTSRWTRDRFDGETFAKVNGKIPIGPARTRAIGRLVGDAAYAALNREDAALQEHARLGDIEARDLFVPLTNQGLAALAATGVVDKPGYVAGRASIEAAVRGETDNHADGPETPSPGTDARTTLYAFQIGPVSFTTFPGELFPELYYGVATYNRSNPLAYDVRPEAGYIRCSADARAQGGVGPDRTGRPHEPSIREKQISRFDTASIHFALGSTPDLMGTIVPGYDFSIYGVPVASGVGAPIALSADGGMRFLQAPDLCADRDIIDGERYGVHVQEAGSSSSMLAPAVTCTLSDMLHPELSLLRTDEACLDWARWKKAGVHNPLQHSTRRFDSGDPDRNRIRHY